ncbi:MAG: glycosyltransferase [Holophaga sp.]|nr:glycosyltransferase [Holophaga sp.]
MVPLAVPLVLLALVALEWWLTLDRVRHFPELPEPSEARPTVCLCMPVRNEVFEIGSALDSWLDQDFASLRLVVIDDGSTDGSTQLLQARALAFPDRLQVFRNDTLPPGWLGKNHALHVAVQQPQARAADWLLFVDADIHAQPDLLARAIAHLEAKGGDFLALWPAMRVAGFWERVAIPSAFLMILWGVPPRRVQDPTSRFAFGAGAFILVRRAAYDAIGGHAAAPLLAIDDVGLAIRLKQAGYGNALAKGAPHLWLRPAHGFVELVASLRKNVLGLPGMLLVAPFLFALALVFFSAPVWLILMGQAWAGILLWLAVTAMIGLAQLRFSGARIDGCWALWPLALVPTLAAIVLAAWDRLRGVNRWRGRDVVLHP